MYDLSNEAQREALEDQIERDIEAYCVKKYHDGHRKHLGASIMGKNCDRFLWSTFRWLKEHYNEGRIYRLFNVGNEAEPRFVDYLKGIGFEVREKDPETGEQFRISGVNGHYGGGLDGMCKAPIHYQITEDLVFLNEFKTNNTGSGFLKIREVHLSKSKPEHWVQACQYGYKMGLKYCLYMIENKNDSTITIRIVELDWRVGEQAERRAHNIIHRQQAPEKIALDPAYYDCKYCEFSEICHFGKPAEKNCRSCKYARPVEDKQWHCDRWQKSGIPDEVIKVGCPEWISIIAE